MLLNDWYQTYLIMVEPRTSDEVLNITLKDRSKKEIIDGASMWMEIFFGKAIGHILAEPSVSDQMSGIAFLENAGCLKSLAKYDLQEPLLTEANLMLRTIGHRLIKDKNRAERILLNEIEENFNNLLLSWGVYVRRVVNENAPLELLDVLEGVFDRDALLTLENLSRVAGICEENREDLAVLDKLYSQNCENCDALVSTDNEPYYPKDTFWWYYKRPYYAEIEL